MKNCIWLFGALLLVSNAIYASENNLKTESQSTYWVDLGFLGYASSSEFSGIGSVSGLSISNQYGLFKLRYSYLENGDPLDFAECLFKECELETIEDWGLMYGKMYANNSRTFSIGLSRVKGESKANEKNRFSTIGIPMEYEWRFSSGKHFSFGGSVSGNLNDESSFAGVYLKMYAGKLMAK